MIKYRGIGLWIVLECLGLIIPFDSVIFLILVHKIIIKILLGILYQKRKPSHYFKRSDIMTSQERGCLKL